MNRADNAESSLAQFRSGFHTFRRHVMLNSLKAVATVLALLVFTGIGTATIGTTKFQVDPSYSLAEIHHAIRSVTGTFADYTGEIVYEPVHVEQSTINLSIPVKSLIVDNRWGDHPVTGSQLFDVEKYPNIMFTSSKVQNYGKVLKVTGNLSMLGVSREVTMPVKVLGFGTHPVTGEQIARFGLEFDVNLSEFKQGKDGAVDAILGDEIKFKLNLMGVEGSTL